MSLSVPPRILSPLPRLIFPLTLATLTPTLNSRYFFVGLRRFHPNIDGFRQRISVATTRIQISKLGPPSRPENRNWKCLGRIGRGLGLVTSLVLTGGEGEAAVRQGEVKNCVDGALGFFNNLRTPAALVAGAALIQLYANFGDGAVESQADRDEKVLYRRVKVAFTALMLLTIGFQFAVIFMTTVSSVRLLDGGFDPMGRDTVEFLLREFEFPYCAIRFEFLTGLAAFTLALALKSWATFRSIPMLAKGSALLLVAVASEMFAYFDWALVHFKGYLHLARKVFSLYFIKYQLWNTPMSMISLTSVSLAVYSFIRAFIDAGVDVDRGGALASTHPGAFYLCDGMEERNATALNLDREAPPITPLPLPEARQSHSPGQGHPRDIPPGHGHSPGQGHSPSHTGGDCG
ncbi:hypothetical protein AAMO2058_000578700 [Amorphochlora amoebiformis]